MGHSLKGSNSISVYHQSIGKLYKIVHNSGASMRKMRVEPLDRIVIDNRKRVLLMIFNIYNGMLTGGADKRDASEIVVPNEVKSIGFGTFGRCRDVRKIVLPNSVTRIEDDVF